jgi:hypothetical protein
MYNEWSLEAFYHGIDDPALAKDMARLEEIITSFKKAVHTLTGEDPRAELRHIVEIEEETEDEEGGFTIEMSTEIIIDTDDEDEEEKSE